MSQPLEALERANEVRLSGVKQREALKGQPLSVVLPALVNPPEGLAALRLKHVFAGTSKSQAGPIPKVGRGRLDEAFDQLVVSHPRGRHGWNGNLRLRDLTEAERRRLVRTLVSYAPPKWRQG